MEEHKRMISAFLKKLPWQQACARTQCYTLHPHPQGISTLAQFNSQHGPLQPTHCFHRCPNDFVCGHPCTSTKTLPWHNTTGWHDPWLWSVCMCLSTWQLIYFSWDVDSNCEFVASGWTSTHVYLISTEPRRKSGENVVREHEASTCLHSVQQANQDPALLHEP